MLILPVLKSRFPDPALSCVLMNSTVVVVLFSLLLSVMLLSSPPRILPCKQTFRKRSVPPGASGISFHTRPLRDRDHVISRCAVPLAVVFSTGALRHCVVLQSFITLNALLLFCGYLLQLIGKTESICKTAVERSNLDA